MRETAIIAIGTGVTNQRCRRRLPRDSGKRKRGKGRGGVKVPEDAGGIRLPNSSAGRRIAPQRCRVTVRKPPKMQKTEVAKLLSQNSQPRLLNAITTKSRSHERALADAIPPTLASIDAAGVNTIPTTPEDTMRCGGTVHALSIGTRCTNWIDTPAPGNEE